MSNVGPENRCFAKITVEDLHRLSELAADDRRDFFRRFPDWARLYQFRVVCTALCKGAALHFACGVVGINDFDVYTFYAQHPEKAWYAKRRQICDFGDSKFGCSKDKPGFIGRRVDLMGRGIPVESNDDPAPAVERYLALGRTKSARLLTQKPVVILDPIQLIGDIVWLNRSGVV